MVLTRGIFFNANLWISKEYLHSYTEGALLTSEKANKLHINI